MSRSSPRLPADRPRAWWKPDALPVGPVLLVLLLAGGAVGYRWLGTEAALRYVVADVVARSDGKIAIDGVSGSLLDTVNVRNLRYADDRVQVSAVEVTLTWAPAALLHGGLRIPELRARQVAVVLPRPADRPLELPSSLAMPFPVVVDHVRVGSITIERGEEHETVRDLGFRYEGDAARHRIGDFALRGEPGVVSGTASLSTGPPYLLRAAFGFRGTPALYDAVLDLSIAGSLTAIDVAANGRVAGADVSAKARITPSAPVLVAAYSVDVRGLDLHSIGAELPRTALNAVIEGREDTERRYAGALTATNRAPATIDRDGVPLQALRSRYVLAGDRLTLSDLEASLPERGTLVGSGSVRIAPVLESEWRLEARHVDLRSIHSLLAATGLSGAMTARIAPGGSHLDLDLTQDDMALAGEADIAGSLVTVRRFLARARGGEMSGRGSFDWARPRNFTLQAQATRLDPSRFGDFPGASLDARLAVTGALDPAWRLQGDIAITAGSRWKGQPLSGTARGSFSADRAAGATVDLQFADNRVRFNGSLGRPGDRLRYRLDAPRLSGLAPIFGEHWPKALEGGLEASGEIAGSMASFSIDVEARGRDFALGPVRVGALRIGGTSPAAATWRERTASLNLAMDAIEFRGARYAHARLQFRGSAGDHQIDATVDGEDLAAEGTLAGGLAPGPLTASAAAWSGSLTRFVNRGNYPVRLLAPARLDIGRPEVVIRDAQLAIVEGRLDVKSLAWREGRLESRGHFTTVPVAALARLAGQQLPARTSLVVGGEWDVAATPYLNGRLRLHRERGDISFGSESAVGARPFDLGLGTLDIDADFRNDRIDARATLRANRLGEIGATLRIDPAPGASPGVITGAAPLSASITGELASLRPLQPWISTTALVDGSLSLSIALSGTLGDPRPSGTLAARNIRVDAPRYGLHWHDGRARARLADGIIVVDEYSIASGDGRLTMSGKFPLAPESARSKEAPPAELAWSAEHFRLTNRPDLRIVASGEGTAGLRDGELLLRGQVHIEDGRIDIEKSPDAALGDDVIVAGQPRVEQRRGNEDRLASVDLRIDLGRRLRVTGQGIEATLEGNVRVTSGSRGSPLRAQGSVQTIEGTYAAFGQRLQIDRGKLTFDGPVDNPALDMIALRKNLPVEAGVAITGTARLPQVRLTSNPPLPEGQKLAWLVLGQGLDRTTGADLVTLQAAATALFGRGGPAIGTRIARSIGLDDVSVRSAGTTERGGSSQVVALSKRLTDRIYLVFEQGLTAANTALRLEYSLTRTLTLRARAGTASSVGVYFFRAFE